MNTTTKQDTALANAILDLCKKSTKVNHLSLPLSLRGYNHLLDGQPIENDPTTFTEKVRLRNFSRYCLAGMDFLVRAKFCYYAEEVIDNGHYPMDVQYLRITRLGSVYAHLPLIIQRAVIYCIDKAFWVSGFVAKYKWLGTTMSALVAGVGWLRTHDISGYLVALSVAVGVVAMLIANWLHGGSSTEGGSSDDTLA
ncbi:MAG: hypothetical protein JNL16_04765 [Dechloromonas sp.]|nr:hypothetical protein [Dechloromonas sp.]